jgi:hypothetical protein
MIASGYATAAGEQVSDQLAAAKDVRNLQAPV